MTSSRRLSNGRSPLIRKQSQITSFFTPGKSPSGSPGTNPTSSPDPSPSQSQSQRRQEKKPRILIPPSPASDPRSPPPSVAAEVSAAPGDEVVGRRIKVFWPLDKAWYKGRVLSFDAQLGKHLIQYDDTEEEVLDLGKEKFDWVDDKEIEKENKPQRLRRLRRLSAAVESDSGEVEVEDGSGIQDSADDEEWNINERKAAEEDDSEEEVELEDEEDEEVVISSRKSTSRSKSNSTGTKKRRVDVAKLDCKKKFKFDGVEEGTMSKSSLIKTGNSSYSPQINIEREQVLDVTDCCLNAEAAELFGKRDAEKFRFLRELDLDIGDWSDEAAEDGINLMSDKKTIMRGGMITRKDANGRCPADENYDPRTLHLPQEFLRSLSGGQRQWWEFKSKHMDKVLFFKMGKFYELFEMDAHIGAKELDLQYMKGEQPHCGFPEKNFSMNLEKLTRKGYRVLVVEQTETPEQLELRRKEMGSKDKVVKREICGMVTKGTLIEGESLLANPNSAYLLSITEHCQDPGVQIKENVTIGLCLLDASMSKFMVGQFVDDLERHCLRSVLSELRPVEIIKPAKILSPETERAIKNCTRNPLVNDLLPSKEFWNAEKTMEEIKNYYWNGLHALPDILAGLVSAGTDGSHALSALGGCLFYLRQALLDKSLLKCARFEPLPCTGSRKTVSRSFMTLDASALENLEILENSSGGNSGTLFAHLDHCATAFGKRLLKGWLARPLYDIETIKERQDAIACFKGDGLASALEFRKVLLKLPDMERLISRLFASCEGNGRNAKKVILYEDAAKKQLQEFITSLRGCKAMSEACLALYSALSCDRSSLIQHLLTPGKGLPDMSEVLDHFDNAFDWSEADRTGRIIPHEGGDTEYDAACKRVNEIESCLTRYLKEQRKLLGETMINYVTVGKDSYLIEVPESLRGSIPREYELQSSKKGYFRYWTPEIKDFLSELSQAEAEKESKLKGILQRLIEQFSAQHVNWRQLVSVIAELDALISLAIASDHCEGPTCRPTIISGNIGPQIFAKALGHPILRSDAIGNGSFVSNDVTIGGASQARIILLTGPNMGGKSTLLRQVCLAVILAQIGADVPAEKFEFSIVDRVFVRMGARDHIMAGQSTFLMELSETASVLSSATRDSLVALDELGRGTSTSDGQVIAASVLEYLVHTVQCRGLFSTHYHRLAVEYEKDKKVSLCHMACQVGKGVGGVEEVTFLYRLTPGSCPKSYGVNVARLAGLPSTVLQKASKKSKDFEINYGKRPGSEGKISNSCKGEEIALIKELLSVLDAQDPHVDCQKVNMNLLCDIQQKAKLLMMEY